MPKDITAVRALGNYDLWLQFEDGTTGVVDVASLVPFTGVFAPLRNPREFTRVAVNPELGTIVWPTGADLDAEVLYAAIVASHNSLRGLFS